MELVQGSATSHNKKRPCQKCKRGSSDCIGKNYTYTLLKSVWPNLPGPLTDDWKVTDDSSVNFHNMFFFIFCYNLAKTEEKHIM